MAPIERNMIPGSNIIILDNHQEDREPSHEEVLEYAEFLGIDVDKEPQLMWIAKEGVVAPVPHPWKACTENEEDVFYFNFETSESIWDHPSDDKFKRMVEEHRQKHVEEQAAKKKATEAGAAEKAKKEEEVKSEASRKENASEEKEGEKKDLANESLASVSEDGSMLNRSASALEESASCGKASGSKPGVLPSLSGANANGKLEPLPEPAASSSLSEKKGEGASSSNGNSYTEHQEKMMELIRKEMSDGSDGDEESRQENSISMSVKDSSLNASSLQDKSLNASLSAADRGGADKPETHSASSSALTPEKEKPADRTSGGSPTVEAKAGGLGNTPDRGLAGVGLATPLSAAAKLGLDDAVEVSGSGARSKSKEAASASASKEAAAKSQSQSAAESQSQPAAGASSSSASRPAAAVAAAAANVTRLNGHDGAAKTSNASEVDEDLSSEFDVTSPGQSIGENFVARGVGDTLELSATEDGPNLSSSLLSKTAPTALVQKDRPQLASSSSEVVAQTSSKDLNGLASQVESLSRSLAMLRDIRMKQQEYLRILKEVGS
eukprot:TRINITY_DN100859_c0_g1_i1.p1 TRINITY_DN100859_c0_g1~~TRINITY_DN100859_c0_g1_i1.p1  ORF type:complete len:572 (-),score=167.50 TRINITY_DN100859_c0_g1_i1:98-1759(-)